MLKSVLNKFAMNEKVTSDMIMGDIIRLHPEVVDTLISQGMHCLGCPSSQRKAWPMPALSTAWTRKSLLKPSTLPLKRTNSKRRTYHERIFRTHPFLVIQ